MTLELEVHTLTVIFFFQSYILYLKLLDRRLTSPLRRTLKRCSSTIMLTLLYPDAALLQLPLLSLSLCPSITILHYEILYKKFRVCTTPPLRSPACPEWTVWHGLVLGQARVTGCSQHNDFILQLFLFCLCN